MRDKVLLARPNKIIISHMMHTIQKAECEPLKIKSLNDLYKLHENDLNSVVISTSVSSTIEEDYREAIRKVRTRFQNTPIILATLSKVESVRRSISGLFERNMIHGLNADLGKITPDDIIIVRKADLVEDSTHDRLVKALVALK